MRLLGMFFTACVVLAAAQAVVTGLFILLLIGLAYCLFVAPRETLGFLGLMLIGGLFQAHPIAFLSVVALLAITRRLA